MRSLRARVLAQQPGDVPRRQVGDHDVGGEGRTLFRLHGDRSPALDGDARRLLPKVHLPAVAPHSFDQRPGDGPHAALSVGHAATGQVQRRRAVEGVGVAARRLGGDEQLGVDKEPQSLRAHRAGRGTTGRSASRASDWLEPLAQIVAQPGETITHQAGSLAGCLGRPGGQPQRQVPQGVGGGFLPAPEGLGLRAKGAAALRPTAVRRRSG